MTEKYYSVAICPVTVKEKGNLSQWKAYKTNINFLMLLQNRMSTLVWIYTNLH